MGSAEQASLVSIYLVGFQLPLSGAVLALPDWAGTLARPFIAAYWSWSGVLQTLRGERYYDIVQTVIQTQLSPATLYLGPGIPHHPRPLRGLARLPTQPAGLIFSRERR